MQAVKSGVIWMVFFFLVDYGFCSAVYCDSVRFGVRFIDELYYGSLADGMLGI